MRRVVFFFLLPILAAVFPAGALAKVQVKVDLGAQRMQVFIDGRYRASWPVSTGRRGYDTPTGNYRPFRLEEEWYSKQYDDAPMHYAVFFKNGYAIHATGDTRRLGRRASHGCIRLAPGHAAKFFSLVKHYGIYNTSIAIRR